MMMAADVGRRCSLSTKSVVVPLALCLLLLPAGVAAQPPDPRQSVELTVAGPEDVPLGNLARVVARLRDASGRPLSGARIVFTSPAAFAGTVGEIALGEASTDAEGVATLDHQLRVQGQNQITVRFSGDEASQPAEAATVVVATGQTQLVRRAVPPQMPLIGTGSLLLVLGIVWSVYFAALLLVAGIPGSPASSAPSADLSAGLSTGGER